MLTHVDSKNNPGMVNVGDKSITKRTAQARAIVILTDKILALLSNGEINSKKGPVFQTAIIAGTMAAKKTSDLIPMCHPLLLSGINCDIEEKPELPGFKLIVTAKLNGQTGVEMEALTGVSVGLLTIYDMVKAIDKSMIISKVQLENKSGGKSGDFNRKDL